MSAFVLSITPEYLIFIIYLIFIVFSPNGKTTMSFSLNKCATVGVVKVFNIFFELVWEHNESRISMLVISHKPRPHFSVSLCCLMPFLNSTHSSCPQSPLSNLHPAATLHPFPHISSSSSSRLILCFCSSVAPLRRHLTGLLLPRPPLPQHHREKTRDFFKLCLSSAQAMSRAAINLSLLSVRGRKESCPLGMNDMDVMLQHNQLSVESRADKIHCCLTLCNRISSLKRTQNFLWSLILFWQLFNEHKTTSENNWTYMVVHLEGKSIRP